MTVPRKKLRTVRLPAFERVGRDIGRLVAEKNRAYGDSFAKGATFLRLLYPHGVRPEQYGDLLALIRVFDKQMRIATAKDAFGENPWQDLCGYSLLSIVYGEARRDKGT